MTPSTAGASVPPRSKGAWAFKDGQMVRDPDTEPDVLTWDDCLQKAALSLDLASKTPLPSPHLGVAEAWLRLAALIKEPK